MTSPCSDAPAARGRHGPPRRTRRRRGGPAARRALPVVALALLTALAGPVALAALAALAALPSTAAAQAPEVRRDGEHGLWVRRAGDALEVHWITRAASAGFLEARRGDSVLSRAETPSSFLHSASVRRPDEGRLVLRYGAADDPDDRHETSLRLPLERPRAEVELPAVDSLYVMGDVHGEFDRMVRVLRAAGLVDAEERWSGGRAHLVLLGDLFDRGSDVTRTLWFLYGLEEEARRAGGAVHVVLGNHEIMVMTRDLRYVSWKERSLASLRGTSYTRLFDLRDSVLGRWLASRPALLRIGDVLLAHGGLGPEYAHYSVQAFDDSLAAFVGGDVFRRWSDSTFRPAPVDSAALDRRIDFFFGEGSVFWYRGYLAGPGGGPVGAGTSSASDAGTPGAGTGRGRTSAAADSLAEVLDRVLREHDARVHVVAHTPVPHVQERFGGRLIGVDLRRPAAELLLLARDGEGRSRWRIGEDGVPRPLGGGAAVEP